MHVLGPDLFKIIHALEKPAEHRSPQDIQELIIPMIKQISFFTEQNNQISQEDFKFIAEKLKF